MAICRCSRILSQIESTASRMINEAAMEMSSGVSRIGFMAFPNAPPPFDSADRPGVPPGLDRELPAGWLSLLPFAPGAAPRPERPSPHPVGRAVGREGRRGEMVA